MWRWNVDSQTEIASAIPAPDSAAPQAISGTEVAAAMKANGSAKSPSARAASNSACAV
jgi:hypothetical protein